MNRNKYPKGWDQKRVEDVLAHYERQSEEQAVAEDEEGIQPSATVMSVPHELVSKVRELIAKHRG